MIWPITTLCLLLCIAWAYRRDGLRSPIVLALGFWAFGVAVMTLPLLTFNVLYAWWVDAFVAACLIATTAAYLVVRNPPTAAPSRPPDPDKERTATFALGLLGILGCLILLLSSGATFSLSYLTENLSTIRSDAFATLEANERPGLLPFIGSYVASCSLLCVLAVSKVEYRSEPAMVLLAVVNFALASAVSVFVFAGRATLVFCALLFAVSIYVRGRKIALLKPKVLVTLGVALVAVYFLGTAFVSSREKSLGNPAEVLEDTQRAEISAWVQPIARENYAIETGMVSVGYFSASLPTMAYYLQRPGELPGPMWGDLSFPLLARTVQKFGFRGRPYSYPQTRADTWVPLTSAGQAGNVWATWIRDLIVDFGYIGALVFSALFGVVIAWARNRYERYGTLHFHLIEVIGCFTFAFGAFTSVLPFAFILNAFIMALAVMVYLRFRVNAHIPRTSLHLPLVRNVRNGHDQQGA